MPGGACYCRTHHPANCGVLFASDPLPGSLRRLAIEDASPANRLIDTPAAPPGNRQDLQHATAPEANLSRRPQPRSRQKVTLGQTTGWTFNLDRRTTMSKYGACDCKT